jgi:hypothetical protein
MPCRSLCVLNVRLMVPNSEKRPTRSRSGYFGVDFDAEEGQIAGAVHDYFQGVKDGLALASRNGPTYTIGVYGSGLALARLGVVQIRVTRGAG